MRILRKADSSADTLALGARRPDGTLWRENLVAVANAGGPDDLEVRWVPATGKATAERRGVPAFPWASLVQTLQWWPDELWCDFMVIATRPTSSFIDAPEASIEAMGEVFQRLYPLLKRVHGDDE